MAAYIRFPELRLPSGRYCRIEIMTQQITGGNIQPPYTTARTDVDVVPFLEDGIPEFGEEAAPDAGMIGGDTVEFVFINMPIQLSPTVVRLHDLISAYDPAKYAWNILVYYADVPGGYNNVPEFRGFIETSEPSGEFRHFEDKEGWEIKLVAKNILFLLEHVSVEMWLNSHLQHATYDIQPSAFKIDGYTLNHYFYQAGNGEYWHHPASTKLWVFKLTDIIASFGDALALPGKVNDHPSDSLMHSWEYDYCSAYGAPPTYVTKTADDLAVVSRGVADDGIAHLKWWGIFDPETKSPISVHNYANALEALKAFLVPLGMTAKVETNTSGQAYLRVREVDLESGIYARDVLEDVSLDPGRDARYGMRVVTANNGHIASGEVGDASIDNMYMCGRRLRVGDRWTTNFYAQDTGDLHCLFSALWLLDSNTAHAVVRIRVKTDGNSGTGHEVGAPLITGSSTYENSAWPLGAGIAQATLAYYYNRTASPSQDEVGVYRRYTHRIEFAEYGIRARIYGTDTAGTTDKLTDSGAFTLDEIEYKRRRVRNLTTKAEAYITGKDSNDVLSLSADIMSTGDDYVILPATVGERVYVNGLWYRIRRIFVDDNTNLVRYAAERGTYQYTP